MTRAHLIYPIERRTQRELEKAKQDSLNGSIIVRFYKARSVEMTGASMLLYVSRLNMMSKLLGKKFDEATIEDIENLVFELSRLKLAQSTQNRIRKILKGFYKWLKRCPKGQFPPEVAWILTKKTALLTVKEEDLLPFDECIRISEFTTNLRDRSLIQCQLDAGCRIGEILTVRVGEVKFNEYGAILNSDGKTGEAPLILTWSAKTLAQWLNIHPFRNDPTAPLFPKNGRATPIQLPYSGAKAALKKCLKRAGYGKRRVWFHLFKHVSCTYDCMRGMPQPFRNFKHHWSQNSDMGKVYEHLSNSVIPKIQQWDQMKTDNLDTKPIIQEEVKLTTRCRRCEFENSRDSRFCNRCAFPLNESEAAEMSLQRTSLEKVLKKIREDPEKMGRLLSMAR